MILRNKGFENENKHKKQKKRNGRYQTEQKKEFSAILLFFSLKNQIESIALQHTVLHGRQQPSKNLILNNNNMAIVSRVPAFKLKLQQI